MPEASLLQRFATAVVTKFGLDPGVYTAEELNAAVGAWPSPARAARELELDLAKFPIVPRELSFEVVGRVFMKYADDPLKVFPVFFMETNDLDAWESHVDLQMLRAYLADQQLGVSLGYEESSYQLRGMTVHLCDLRPVFFLGAGVG